MFLSHCPLVDDTRLILGVDSVVAINNLPHFGVLTQGRCVLGTVQCSVPLCVLVFVWSMSHLISPRVTPPPSLTLYDFLCQAPEEPPNIRNFLPGQNSAGSWLRHIYPLFDVGFNVSTVLQHDVVWVQMFNM